MARDPSEIRTTRSGRASYRENGASQPNRPGGPLPLTNGFLRKCLSEMPQTNFASLRGLLDHRWQLVTSSIGQPGLDFVHRDDGYTWNTGIQAKSDRYLAIHFHHDGRTKASNHGASAPITRLKKSPIAYRYKDSVNVGNHSLSRLNVRVGGQLPPCRLMIHQRVSTAIATQQPLQTCFYKSDGWAGIQWLLLLPTNGVAILRIDEDSDSVFIATVLSAQQANVLTETANPPKHKRWSNGLEAVVG